MPDKDIIFCTRCGASTPPDSAFCQECGSPIEGADPVYRQHQVYVPHTATGYARDFAEYRANSRLRFIRILMIGYLVLGFMMTAVGLFIDSFIDTIAQNPDAMAAIGTEMFNELVASSDMLYTSGIIYGISSAAVLGSLVLTIMKKNHMIAVVLCAAGSAILSLPMIGGYLFTVVGLIVTLLLFSTKPAFTP